MAPHDTNTKREARRHAVPLIGMGILVVLVLVGFVWWLGYAADGEGDPTKPLSEQQATQPAN